MTRKEANEEIIKLLAEQMNLHPDTRFGQLLRNSGIIVDFQSKEFEGTQWSNHFYEESKQMLERVQKTLKGEIK